MSAEPTSKDLTTTAGPDIDPNDKNMETSVGTARGNENELSCPECNSSKIHKNKDKDDPRFGDGEYACNNCGNTFNSGSEEGGLSIAGPPADSTMHANNFDKKKEKPLVLPTETNESVPDKALADKTRANVPKTDLAQKELTTKELGENYGQGILLNENYIQDQFGVF